MAEMKTAGVTQNDPNLHRTKKSSFPALSPLFLSLVKTSRVQLMSLNFHNNDKYFFLFPDPFSQHLFVDMVNLIKHLTIYIWFLVYFLLAH